MRKILLILVVLAVAACGSGPQTGEVSPLYRTVSSRAVALMHFGNCSDALSLLLDSASVFRTLDYGHLSVHEAILSYDFGATLIPLLAIDAGKASDDTSAQAAGLLERASAAGFKTYYTGRQIPKRAAVLLSRSQASIDEAVQHINSGSSILDAPGFSDALRLSDGSEGAVFLKNGAARRWIPAGLLKEEVGRTELAKFVAGAAHWTVLDFNSYSSEGISVKFMDEGDGACLSHLFAVMQAGESRLSDAIPDGCSFALDLPLADWKKYCEAYEECLDVRAALSKYKGRLAGLRKKCGKNPRTWAEELNPKEIALIRWNGGEVLLLRPARKPKAAETAQNLFPGYIPSLFGGAFAIADDSFMSVCGEWLLFGGQEAVEGYCEAEKVKFLQGFSRNSKYLVWTKDLSMQADNKNIQLNVY